MPPLPDQPEDPLRLWLVRGERWAPLFAIIVTAFAVPAAVLFLLPSLLGFFAAPLDPHTDLYAVNRPLAFTFLDASGAEAGHRGAVIGQRLRLEDMPAYLPAAFIATEDRRFYMHNGIDPVGLTRALLLDLRARHFVAGGSTITQQTAKIVYTGQERTVSRKLTELIDAAGLEKSLSKKQILELYLNRIYLGSASYGVDGAAHVYFGTSARNVTLAQAAMLATLTRAPSVFSPRRDLARAQARAALVLKVMVETGAITKAEADQAKAAPAMVVDNASVDARNFFFDTAADQAKQLAAKNGVSDLIVHTTLEPRLQEAARQAAVDVIGKYGKRDRTHQAAVVIMKPDGAVSALIGGIDYDTSVYNRATQARRQPGSAFKPFVYLAALEAGISPWDERDDEPVDINGYQPTNFGNKQYGTLTLADALAHSVNTITVNLGQEVGIDKVIGAARRLGITAPLTPTPSLALGTSEVAPLELTGAYAAFADGGYRVTPYFVTEVDQSDGKPLYRRQAPQPQRVIDPQVDRDMLAMMWNVIATGTGGGASLAPREAAGKTGTTQNSQDAWFVGFTTDYVAGVWVGNDDNSATRGVTGGTLPAMIWKSAMRAAEKGLPMKPLDRSPPQQPNDLFPGSPNSVSASIDDEAGNAAMAGNQRFPDLPPPPEPSRGHGGGILGWLFGDDDPRPPPPPPPRSYEDRDDR